MIKIKVYGLMRLDSGIKELEAEAGTLREIISRLPPELDREKLRRCSLFVNGRPAKLSARLKDGDELQILSPVAGG